MTGLCLFWLSGARSSGKSLQVQINTQKPHFLSLCSEENTQPRIKQLMLRAEVQNSSKLWNSKAAELRLIHSYQSTCVLAFCAKWQVLHHLMVLSVGVEVRSYSMTTKPTVKLKGVQQHLSTSVCFTECWATNGFKSDCFVLVLSNILVIHSSQVVWLYTKTNSVVLMLHSCGIEQEDDT